MKKTKILLAATLLATVGAQAQTYWTNTGGTATTVQTTTTGNCAIQGGTIDMTVPADGAMRIITAGSRNAGLSLGAGPNGAGMIMRAGSNLDRPGTIDFSTTGSTGSSSCTCPNGYGFYYQVGSTYNQLMRIWNDGKVVIGNELNEWTENQYGDVPDGYDLFVANGILTDKLKVAQHTDPANWSDFVFNKDYKLMPLNKVEEYVNANRHLPNVPSAQEVSDNGIDVASMDAKLLQKIEELTLYVIKQQKEIDELKSKMK